MLAAGYLVLGSHKVCPPSTSESRLCAKRSVAGPHLASSQVYIVDSRCVQFHLWLCNVTTYANPMPPLTYLAVVSYVPDCYRAHGGFLMSLRRTSTL